MMQKNSKKCQRKTEATSEETPAETDNHKTQALSVSDKANLNLRKMNHLTMTKILKMD